LPNQGFKTVDIPDWLKGPERRPPVSIKGREYFLDKTLGHIILFVEDTVFNKKTSKKKGLLQSIDPVLKLITILSFIVLISLQRHPIQILPYLLLSITLIFLSRIPFLSILKKIIPITALTLLISLPASLNMIVGGKEVITLYTFETPQKVLFITIPERIAITEEGLLSSLTLIMRVSTSLIFVFLMTMTTGPERFIKALTLCVPGILRSIISITYRYIFLLIEKVELFIMGLESRRIARVSSSGGRRWVASRIGLLFSISIELSRELSLSMSSRGYNPELTRFKKGKSQRPGVIDLAWLIFCLAFNGLFIWKSLI